MEKPWQAFFEADPHFLRLKQAIKNILALCVATIILWQAPLLIKVPAVLAAVICMQGVYGETIKQQLITFCYIIPFDLIAYAAGLLSKPYPVAQFFILFILAFFVFFPRKFGDRFLIFPLFIWVAAFFATILPIQSIGYSILSFLLGLIIGACIFIFIFPYNQFEIFRNNVNAVFDISYEMLTWLTSTLKNPISSKKIHISNFKFYRKYRIPFISNQELISTQSPIPKIQKLAYIHLQQYRFSKAISIIAESIESLLKTETNIPDEIRSELKKTLYNLSEKIRYYHVDKNSHLLKYYSNDVIDENIDKLRQFAKEVDFKKHKNLLNLLNTIFGCKRLIVILNDMDHYDIKEF